MNTPHPSRLCLYDTAQLNAVLDKMASQLMAMVNGTSPCAVIGVLRRGAPLADLLLRRMVRVHGLKPPLRLDLAVKRYSDDLTLLYADPLLSEPAPSAPLDLTGHQLLVVDDVLYTGHSMLKVVSHLVQKKPLSIRIACLADRCTATLPVHADVVGVKLAVAPTDIIECHVPPYEARLRIEMVKPAKGHRPEANSHK